MERKTEVVRSFVRSGELKQALKIARIFDLVYLSRILMP